MKTHPTEYRTYYCELCKKSFYHYNYKHTVNSSVYFCDKFDPKILMSMSQFNFVFMCDMSIIVIKAGFIHKPYSMYRY